MHQRSAVKARGRYASYPLGLSAPRAQLAAAAALASSPRACLGERALSRLASNIGRQNARRVTSTVPDHRK